MPPIVTSAEIERPAAEVFTYATDPTRFNRTRRGTTAGRLMPASRPVMTAAR